MLALGLLAAGIVHLDGGGHGLLIGPAEANKGPSRLPRIFAVHEGRGGRGGAFRSPGFSPLPEGRAFAPSLATKSLPPFPPLPKPQALPPLPSREGVPSALKPPPPGRDPGSAKFAGLPQKDPPPGSWGALVRPVTLPVPPKAPAVAQTPPPAVMGRPKLKSFREVLEKLGQHHPQQKAPGKGSDKASDKGPDKSPDKAPGSPPGAKPRETVEKGTAGPAPVPPRRLGGRVAGELLPPIGTFKAQEVLAINLTAEGLAKARAGGFAVAGQTELPGLGLTLTHLVAPDALNAVTARERLFDLVPDGGFVLNRVYAPYRLGSGPGSSAGLTGVHETGAGCPSERCFGSTLIKWQPQLSACARDLKVGIIDTGFDKSHPALADVRYAYKEFLPDGSVKASPQHGTGVLSILAGKADSGTPGLIPEASYAIANAFFDDADGLPMSDTAQMVRALDWLKRSGVAVVNLSFAGPEDDLVHLAVQELAKSGAVIVAAAGNDGPGAPPSYPAAYGEVIAVTAVDRSLAIYRYAGRGPHIDLAGPGVDIWTAIPGRREGPQTGTSFAVPYVTAVVAVALSGTALAPDSDALSPKQRVLAKLQGSVLNLGGKGRDPVFGEGLVQAPATCQPASAPVIGVSLKSPSSEPWAGTVVRTVDGAGPLVAGAWVATVSPASGGGAAR